MNNNDECRSNNNSTNVILHGHHRFYKNFMNCTAMIHCVPVNTCYALQNHIIVLLRECISDFISSEKNTVILLASNEIFYINFTAYSLLGIQCQKFYEYISVDIETFTNELVTFHNH